MDFLNEKRPLGREGEPRTEVQQEQQKEHQYQFSMKLRKGLKLWELNVKTFVLSEIDVSPREDVTAKVEFSDHGYAITGSTRKAFYDKDCLYFQALNYANAERKVNRFIRGQSKKLVNMPIGKRKI